MTENRQEQKLKGYKLMSVLSRKSNRNQIETENNLLGQPLLIDERIQEAHDSHDVTPIHEQATSRPTSGSLHKDAHEDEKHINRKATGRLYANNAPRIFLETITARTALIIIVATYAIFILGFGLDLNTIYKSFNSNKYKILANDCDNNNDVDNNHVWGCTSGKNWNSSITHLENVLSIKLRVDQSNITHILAHANQSFVMTYNSYLWACYNENGCDNNFALDDSYTSDPNLWQQVLFKSHQSITINLPDTQDLSNEEYTLEIELIPNTFQNQESIPTNGLVKAYHVNIQYLEDPYGLFTAPTTSTNDTSYLEYISYIVDISNRDQEVVADAFTIILMFFTIVLLCFYVYVLSKQKHLLSEQKWLVVYIVLVIFIQNPVYCVIVWFDSAPRPGDAYASYVLTYIAQSGLFILWLLFADSVHRKLNSKIVFYSPKVFIGLVILICGIAILTFQFPGVTPNGNRSRNAVEAVDNWSNDLKKNFIGFTLCYMLLTMLWAIGWFIQLYFTGKKLRKLPYMNTRYLQLSYRFFFVQATLLTIYYVLQYVAVVYYMTEGSNNDYDLTSVCDTINTLLRQQTHLFGKILFLTVYALILTFLFLPSNLWENSAIKATLAATYVITEQERIEVVKQRRHAIQRIRKNVLNQVTGVNHLVNTKADVFCVETALQLRNVAFQAYYDPIDLKTESGFDGIMDLESIGYEMINKFYSPEYEVFCFIAREKTTKQLVVAFR